MSGQHNPQFAQQVNYSSQFSPQFANQQQQQQARPTPQHHQGQPHSLNPQPPQLPLAPGQPPTQAQQFHAGHHHGYAGAQAHSSSFGPSRQDGGRLSSSTAGRSSLSGVSNAGGGGVLPHGARGSGPYTRPSNQIVDASSLPGPAHPVKASSTTSEFTKRKNWSQHIIDEIQDFMHVVSPEGRLIVASPSIEDLAGWKPGEIVGKSMREFVHPEDVAAYEGSFAACLATEQPLTIYYRFKTSDERFTLFEVTGHPYFSSEGEESAGKEAKCFFGMARPYPSKNQAMLDSFLELKMENERLRQELLLMYADFDNDEPMPDPTDSRTPFRAVPGPDAILAKLDEADSPRAHNMAGSSSDQPSFGALGISLGGSTSQSRMEDKKKKKAPKAEEGEFVCRDCGTVDSPEWRKGPDGPKSLCNACGLRYAKVRSKENKLAKAGGQ